MRRSINNDYRKINGDSFLLELYSNITKENPDITAHHWHNEPEVIFCVDGAIDVNCNGETFKMSKNDILFINSSQIHSLHIYPFSKSLIFVFDLNSCISQRMDICDQKYILPLKNLEIMITSGLAFQNENKNKKDELVEIINHIIDLETNRPYAYQIGLKGYLFLMLSIFVSACPINKYQNQQYKNIVKNYESLKTVLDYFDNNYKEKIKIGDLAKLTHMSTPYFCKYFKSFTGNTPVDYINMIRIENAVKLLKTSNKRIIDIAYEVGFQNFSYFSKVFKKIKKISPTEYRDSLGEEID